MGKRSDFARRPMDDYPTIDPRAVPPLLPHLVGVRTFAEPCAGEGRLIAMLKAVGLHCSFRSDIATGLDARDAYLADAGDVFITNPPWTRKLLHPIIRNLQQYAPTWLLFDADWPHTVQAAPFLPQCRMIVSVGRLRWIEGTGQTGKDNCAWYCFDARHTNGPCFVGLSRPAGVFA